MFSHIKAVRPTGSLAAIQPEQKMNKQRDTQV